MTESRTQQYILTDFSFHHKAGMQPPVNYSVWEAVGGNEQTREEERRVKAGSCHARYSY